MNLFKKKEVLKNLSELSLLQLPLKRIVDKNYVLGVREDVLERYLKDENFNIYSSKALTFEEVVENDLTTECTLIADVMHDLGFSMELADKDTLLFFINNEIESRHIEIIQEVCGVKSGLNYSVGDFEEDNLCSTIYVYDSNNNKEYKIIYSFENDDYVLENNL